MARPAKRSKDGTRNPQRVAQGEKAVPAPPSDSAQFVTLAHLVRARGLAGEVAANIYTDFPERLTELTGVWLLDASGRRRAARVQRCWLSTSRGGQAIFHFEGANSVEDAEKLVGCEVQIPLADRVPLPAGRYYVSDLIGCEVFEVKEGKDVKEVREGASIILSTSSFSFTSLGLVRDVFFESGTPLLTVDTPSGELLIPMAEEVCTRIEVGARRIEVRLPNGLRELNRPPSRD